MSPKHFVRCTHEGNGQEEDAARVWRVALKEQSGSGKRQKVKTRRRKVSYRAHDRRLPLYDKSIQYPIAMRSTLLLVFLTWNMLSPVGPALQDVGGSRPRSASSC